FQTGRRIRASERADDRLLNRSIGTFLCVSRRLDLDRGRRRFRVPWQADDDRQPARTLAFQHLHVVRNFLVCREDRHGPCGQRLRYEASDADEYSSWRQKEALAAPRSLWRRSETLIGTAHAKLGRVSKVDPATSALLRESGYERGDRLEIADPCEVGRELRFI